MSHLPLRFLEKLRAGEDPAAVFNELAKDGWLRLLLEDTTSLKACLEAGLDPNSTWEGWPILATTMLLNQPSSHGALAILLEHGADWSTPVSITVGNWRDKHTITAPVIHAVMHRMQGSVYWPQVAIRDYGLDPNLVDPVWGGNLAHHALLDPFYGRLALPYLEEAGVNLEHVAKGDEAVVAWVKLTGEWVPEWHGLSANQYLEKIQVES